MKGRVKQWATIWTKKCRKRFWQKEMEDLPRLLKEQDYKDFDNSKLLRDATKLFGCLSESHFILKPSEYTLIRDYLLSYLCINNASRTGAIAYMKRSEVKNPFRQSEETMTFTVLDHKTSGPAGPAPLCISLSTYRNLAIFLKRLDHPSIVCQNTEITYSLQLKEQ